MLLVLNCIQEKFSNLVKENKNYKNEYLKIKKMIQSLVLNLGIEVHAGHGLDYKTTSILK